jgi:hypothetical protein
VPNLKFNFFPERLRSSRGISLAEVVMGIALTGIFVSAYSQIVITHKQSEVLQNSINDLDREHLLSIQKARNLQHITDLLTERGVSLSDDGWKTCLSGSGLACSSRSRDFEAISLAGGTSNSGSTTSQGAGTDNQTASSGQGGYGGQTSTNSTSQTYLANFDSVMNMSIICSSFSCDRVRIRVRTSDVAGKLKARTTEIVIPGPALVSGAEAVFNCASQGRISAGVDFSQRNDLCRPPETPQPSCSSGPVGSVDGLTASSCQQAENRAPCANGAGVSVVGLFENQSQCAPAPPSAPPAPPVTTLPPSISGCSATSITWSSGFANCQGNLTAAPNGGSSSVTDLSGPDTGSASFACSNGSWLSNPGSTCANGTPPTMPPPFVCNATSNVCGANKKTCYTNLGESMCLDLYGQPCPIGQTTCDAQPPTTTLPPPTTLPPADFCSAPDIEEGPWVADSGSCGGTCASGGTYLGCKASTTGPGFRSCCSAPPAPTCAGSWSRELGIGSAGNCETMTAGPFASFSACEAAASTPAACNVAPFTRPCQCDPPTTTTTLPPACSPLGTTINGLGYSCGSDGIGMRTFPSPTCCSGWARGSCPAFYGEPPELTCVSGP